MSRIEFENNVAIEYLSITGVGRGLVACSNLKSCRCGMEPRIMQFLNPLSLKAALITSRE
jgi:hypothetical protein